MVPKRLLPSDPPVPPESPADIARAAASRPGFGLGALLIFAVVGVAWFNIFFVPVKPLPIQTGNGTYTNPCCAPLTLLNGEARSTDVLFRYVIQPGKEGPLVLVDKHNVVVDGGHLHVVDSRAGQFLPLARGSPPEWLEVDGQRFMRLR